MQEELKVKEELLHILRVVLMDLGAVSGVRRRYEPSSQGGRSSDRALLLAQGREQSRNAVHMNHGLTEACSIHKRLLALHLISQLETVALYRRVKKLRMLYIYMSIAIQAR